MPANNIENLRPRLLPWSLSEDPSFQKAATESALVTNRILSAANTVGLAQIGAVRHFTVCVLAEALTTPLEYSSGCDIEHPHHRATQRSWYFTGFGVLCIRLVDRLENLQLQPDLRQ